VVIVRQLVVFALVFCIIIFSVSGCTKNLYPSNISDSPSYSNQENTGNSDAPQVNRNYGISTWNIDYSETPTEWTGGEITTEISLENGDLPAEYGILLFIDGFRFPLSTNEHQARSYMPIFTMKENESDRKIKITFTPESTKVNEIIYAQLYLILNPSFKLESTKNVNYLPNHNLPKLSPLPILVKKSTEQADPEIDTSLDSKEIISAEVEEEYKNYDLEGNYTGTNLDTSQIYLMQSNKIDPFFEGDKGKDISLRLSFLGGNGTYRCSLYINHELIPAFNGKFYFDVSAERKLSIVKNVTIPAFITENLGEWNFIYIVYNYINGTVADIGDKTDSKILQIHQ
jgi:hypothetical protein